jgi:hypothetical protein
MFPYLASLLNRFGAYGAFRELMTDMSDGYTVATTSEQGKQRALAALIGFASRD